MVLASPMLCHVMFTLKPFRTFYTIKISEGRKILIGFGLFVNFEMAFGAKVPVDLI
jgi:hypothetical protein